MLESIAPVEKENDIVHYENVDPEKNTENVDPEKIVEKKKAVAEKWKTLENWSHFHLQGFELELLPAKIGLLLPAMTDSQTERKLSLT